MNAPQDTPLAAAPRAGLASKLQRCELKSIDAATLPAILLLQGDQACVLLGIERGEARVLMPETGQGAVRLPLGELAQRHTGVVAFVRPHFRFDERTPAPRQTRASHWFWGPARASTCRSRPR